MPMADERQKASWQPSTVWDTTFSLQSIPLAIILVHEQRWVLLQAGISSDHGRDLFIFYYKSS